MKMPFRILIAVVGVLLVIGGLGAVKGLQIERMIAHSKAFAPPAQTVAATAVAPADWEATLSAVGSLEAVQGVTVTAELAGKSEPDRLYARVRGRGRSIAAAAGHI
jgi:membrane fusion protein (multidrug efflux system)